MLAGLHASFVIAENVTVDSGGTMNATTLQRDVTGTSPARSPATHRGHHDRRARRGSGSRPQFTDATYTTKLSDTATLLGVFQGDARGAPAPGRRVARRAAPGRRS